MRTCFGPAPAAWTAAGDGHAVTLASSETFGVNAVAGHTAFGEINSATGDALGEVDLTSGRVDVISPLAPGTGGVGAVAADLPWVVWEQLDSANDLTDWSVHVWNRDTGQTRLLATSHLADGSHVAGQQPLPVLSGGEVAWAQPVPTANGIARAELREVDLATGHVATVAAGRISSPVYAGRYLVWGEIDAAGGYSFRAVNAVSLRPQQLPDRLGHPGTIGYLAGSADYLAWGNGDYSKLTLWRIGTSDYPEFTQDGGHQFQFLQLAGHYVLWYNGTTSSVLDLTTGHGFDIPGSVAGAVDRIVMAEPVTPATAGAPVVSRLSDIALASAPTIASCA